MNKLKLILFAALLFSFSAKAQDDDSTFQKIRVGSYGEILGSWQNYGLNRWTVRQRAILR